MVLYNPTSPTTVLTTVSFPFTFAPYPSPDPLRPCTIFWLEILIQFIKINYVYCAPGRLQRYTGKCDKSQAPVLTEHTVKKTDPM